MGMFVFAWFSWAGYKGIGNMDEIFSKIVLSNLFTYKVQGKVVTIKLHVNASEVSGWTGTVSGN